mmetsp:Transcript_17276/g.50187  ORF Transcript_17276/g.50187 Transcript_17276/m.50187 type:complete len:208 (-) Transcript_17276:1511-2134(-)
MPPDDPIGHRPHRVHEPPQHVVVGPAGEQDRAGEQLREGRGHGPQVDGTVVLQPQYDLGGTVEAGHQVGGGVVVAVGLEERAAEVAQLDRREVGAHQDVIRLDVGVDYAVAGQVGQGAEELTGVGFGGRQVYPDAAAEFCEGFAEIEGEVLEEECDVGAVLEGGEVAVPVLIWTVTRLILLATVLVGKFQKTDNVVVPLFLLFLAFF